MRQQRVGNKQARLCVIIPRDLKEAIVKRAFEQGVSISRYVRGILERHLEEETRR